MRRSYRVASVVGRVAVQPLELDELAGSEDDSDATWDCVGRGCGWFYHPIGHRDDPLRAGHVARPGLPRTCVLHRHRYLRRRLPGTLALGRLRTMAWGPAFRRESNLPGNTANRTMATATIIYRAAIVIRMTTHRASGDGQQDRNNAQTQCYAKHRIPPSPRNRVNRLV